MLPWARQAEANSFTGSCGVKSRSHQPPPEKCDVNACANEPKPPRVTWLEPESDEVPDDEWLDEESPL
jgi:hypothetical protein